MATSAVVFAARGETFDLTSTVVARALVGVVLAAPLFATIGTAVGSLTGNTSTVVAGLPVWMLVIEPPAVLAAHASGAIWLAARRLPTSDL